MSANAMPGVDEVDMLRSEVATLQQLLDVLERTTFEQTTKLEKAIGVNRFLAEAGSALVSSLDYASTLQRVARLAIPSFADWSFVHLTDANGTLRRVVAAHSDPSTESRLASVEDSHRADAKDPHGPAKVTRTGQSELVPSLSDEFLAASANDAAHLQQLRAFGFTSYVSVPLIARSKTLGAMTFSMAESKRHYTESDLQLAQQLADRAALAIDNARLFSEVEDARRELEARVLARTAQLQEANSELESFSYSVSHDLRAPIRHISGFADLLSKRVAESADGTTAHYIDAIRTSAKHAGNLVDDLLAFSRMGRAEMGRQDVSMDDLIRQAREDVAPETSGRNIEWHVAPAGSVTGDTAMLRLVWRNLIANAVKYTRKREKAVIEIGRADKEGDAVFFVRDNGVGFDMKYVGKLFGVFQRLHTNDQFEGTGIGLANVRRIVIRHGGKTWSEGEVDHGATFYFSLPK